MDITTIPLPDVLLVVDMMKFRAFLYRAAKWGSLNVLWYVPHSWYGQHQTEQLSTNLNLRSLPMCSFCDLQYFQAASNKTLGGREPGKGAKLQYCSYSLMWHCVGMSIIEKKRVVDGGALCHKLQRTLHRNKSQNDSKTNYILSGRTQKLKQCAMC